MFRSDVVLCRAAGDQPLARMVWSVADDGVFICTQENFQLWAEQSVEPVVVKVPLDAAYEFDEQLFEQMRGAFRLGDKPNAQLSQLWSIAQPFHCQVGARDE